jgi:hypothetical protein
MAGMVKSPRVTVSFVLYLDESKTKKLVQQRFLNHVPRAGEFLEFKKDVLYAVSHVVHSYGFPEADGIEGSNNDIQEVVVYAQLITAAATAPKKPTTH